MGKKVAIGTVVGFVVLFLAGMLIYGFLMKSTMDSWAETAGDCMNLEPTMLLVIVGTLVQALLFALILYKFNVNSLAGGAVAGVWVTFLVSLMYDLWFKGSFDWMSWNMAITDILINTVMGALAGAAIGLVYDKVK